MIYIVGSELDYNVWRCIVHCETRKENYKVFNWVKEKQKLTFFDINQEFDPEVTQIEDISDKIPDIVKENFDPSKPLPLIIMHGEIIKDFYELVERMPV